MSWLRLLGEWFGMYYNTSAWLWAVLCLFVSDEGVWLTLNVYFFSGWDWLVLCNYEHGQGKHFGCSKNMKLKSSELDSTCIQ